MCFTVLFPNPVGPMILRQNLSDKLRYGVIHSTYGMMMSFPLGVITLSIGAGFRLEAMVLFGLNGLLPFVTPLSIELVTLMIRRADRNQVISFEGGIIEAKANYMGGSL